MAAGQLVLAVATDVPTAIAARVLVGAGDAMTFISVLRMIGAWFPGRTVPVVTQLTGILGQLGQVLAAAPLVALLHGARLAGHLPRVRPRSGVLVAVLVAGDAAGRPGRGGPARAARAGRGRRGAGRDVARVRHPDRPLHPPGHPVLRHGLRPAVGLSVPDPRAGPGAGHGRGAAHPPGARRDGRGPAAGPAVRAVAAAPVGAGLRHPRRDRADVDRRPAVAGACAAAGARRARRRPRHQRARAR